MPGPDGFPFVCTHRACGQVAFFMRTDPSVLDAPLESKNVKMPDGSEPELFSRITCGSCGECVPQGDLDITRIQ